ncbi:MAG: CapA family protein [Lachnospiraceae bacterium]|nr:CapA family protein [Lachnospiraceae bacterium]
MKKKLVALLVLSLSIMAVGCGEDKETIAGMNGSAIESGSFADNFTQETESLTTDSTETADGTENHEETEPETIPEPEPYVEPEVDLVMVGDVLMHMRVTNSGKQEDGTYNFDKLFEPTKEMIEAADVAIINQEIIMAGEEYGYSGYPTFNTPTALADSIVNAGFDVVLHATNHTLDKRAQGALNCINYWETNFPDIAVLGMYDNQEERDTIYVYEQDGIRIAILNYTYGTNGIPVPADMPYIVNLMDKTLIKADVEKAKELADFIVVCPHWGTEYTHKPTQAQKDWSDFFLECGVDLVIGTHPHVIEPVEWVENEEGDRMLVYYSLGNFINSSASKGAGVGARFVGAMATVKIAKSEEGEVYIKEYGAEPLVTYVSGNGKTIVTYPMEEFTSEMALESSVHEKDPTFTYEYCLQLWEDVFGNLEEKEQEEVTGQ